MKRLLLPLIVACLAYAPILRADSDITFSDEKTGSNNYTVDRYLYDQDGELTLQPVSILEYAKATQDYQAATRLYRHGRGDNKDWKDAFERFGQAAEAGHAEAQFYLARMYQYGHYTYQDFEKAYHWYQVAGANGSFRAYNNLGYMENTGQGREPNIERAIEYYQKSSDMGFSMASGNLANIYRDGEMGIPADINRALHYQRLALLQWDYFSSDYLKDLAKWTIFESDETDPVAIEQALRTLELLEETGNASAAYLLGYYYDREDGEYAEKESFKHFLKSAEGGITDGMIKSGHKLYNGIGTEKDREAALFWYRKTLDQDEDNKYAIYMMGLFYYRGEVVEKDYPQAIEHFLHALKLKNRFAGDYLAWMAWEGEGSEVDKTQAYAYYLLAGDTLDKRGRNNAEELRGELLPEQLQQAEQIAKDFRALHWGEEQD
ncbi:tetratricopeptide repeat protein [Ruficoccus sp. ZRK36]|uniref:tetratricopeptide repeat protein n=1 Tax=Ruficoccus sp. ZRK36 TaxID=2866311 RepID=UPI001C732D29|nr:tetratricopeptide repeat protein [Ruficoccus sp. ZRK36]QYY37148.1 sel1 repeat family protein [Ruficoccus sp. ZRK36]